LQIISVTVTFLNNTSMSDCKATHNGAAPGHTIRYDTIVEFKVDSKARQDKFYFTIGP